MVLLLNPFKARKLLQKHLKARRLNLGLTQQGLAGRSGVPLPTLRNFEQKGLISLESFLKLLMALDGLEAVVNALVPPEKTFSSLDEMLKEDGKKKCKRGWRK